MSRIARSIIQAYNSDNVKVAQALQQLSDKSLPEWTPFAFSLAARLQEEHRSNRLTPGDTLWQIAVEQLLLPSVDSDHVVSFQRAHAG